MAFFVDIAQKLFVAKTGSCTYGETEYTLDHFKEESFRRGLGLLNICFKSDVQEDAADLGRFKSMQATCISYHVSSVVVICLMSHV